MNFRAISLLIASLPFVATALDTPGIPVRILPIVMVVPERPDLGESLRVTARFEITPWGTPRNITVDGPLGDDVARALGHWLVIPSSNSRCERVARHASVEFVFDAAATRSNISRFEVEGEPQALTARITVPLSQFPKSEGWGVVLESKVLEDGRAPLNKVIPAYPMAAMIRKIAGFAAVRFEVGIDGTPKNVEFVDESATSKAVPGVLRTALRDAARKMRFEHGAAPSVGCLAATFYQSGYLFEEGINTVPLEKYSNGR